MHNTMYKYFFQERRAGNPVTRTKGKLLSDIIEVNGAVAAKCSVLNWLISHSVFYRKEVKDPDVLYNMLKNLLAQIKVRLTCCL